VVYLHVRLRILSSKIKSGGFGIGIILVAANGRVKLDAKP